MLRRALFVSALMLVGTVGFSSSAKAADAEIPFSATVVANCSFNDIVAGTLEPNASNNQLVTLAPGTVNLLCSGDADVSVVKPVQDTGDTVIGPATNLFASVTDGTNTNDTDTNTTPINLAATAFSSGTTPVALTVRMTAGDGFFPASTYNYVVTVTAAPK
ncbi:MAG: hypothetical protein KME23_29370 [Goleter apudmare HA4340-LM2]|nr:hypothetical protein [Goleter apudmare HA4340-LM2]